MEKKLLRTFISIPLPHVVKSVKQMLTSTFETDRVKIRWVKHNNLHLTLHFLGFTPEDDIPMIEKEISDDIDVMNGSKGKKVTDFKKMTYCQTT